MRPPLSVIQLMIASLNLAMVTLLQLIETRSVLILTLIKQLLSMQLVQKLEAAWAVLLLPSPEVTLQSETKRS